MNDLLWNQVRCVECGNVFNAESCPMCGYPLDEKNDNRSERPRYLENKWRHGRHAGVDAVSPWGLAIKLARHPSNDLERVEIGQEILPLLKEGEDYSSGALRILADRVEWLESQWEETKVLLHQVARGEVDSRLRQERDEWKAKCTSTPTTEESSAVATIGH